MKKNTSRKQAAADKVIEAKRVIASLYDVGVLPSILAQDPDQVARYGYETMHACELSREQRIAVLGALLVLEGAAL